MHYAIINYNEVSSNMEVIMSIQITKQDNFIKINISENVLWDEYRRLLLLLLFEL